MWKLRKIEFERWVGRNKVHPTVTAISEYSFVAFSLGFIIHLGDLQYMYVSEEEKKTVTTGDHDLFAGDSIFP